MTRNVILFLLCLGLHPGVLVIRVHTGLHVRIGLVADVHRDTSPLHWRKIILLQRVPDVAEDCFCQKGRCRKNDRAVARIILTGCCVKTIGLAVVIGQQSVWLARHSTIKFRAGENYGSMRVITCA